MSARHLIAAVALLMGQTLSGQTAYEMIVLQEQGDRLAYTAHPSGQPAATFLSTTVTTSQVVFENSTHDFPQQIGYEVKGDALLAWIAGSSNGKPRRIEFPYKRVGCADR